VRSDRDSRVTVASGYRRGILSLEPSIGPISSAVLWSDLLKALMYHLIADLPDNRFAVSVEAFRQQMDMLADANYVVATPQDLLDAITGRRQSDSNAVLLTFDDGYQNTIDVALPILAEFGHSAVMSVCGGYTSDNTRPLIASHSTDVYADVESIRKWQSTGRAVAAHSYSHMHLTRLSDASLRWQLEVDKEMLRAILGEDPIGFAYPYGDYDSRVMDFVSKLYGLAFAADSPRSFSLNTPYAIPRIQVSPTWTLSDFAKRLRNGHLAC
jgi:peptidoglycan/xylan/chitin deacetylase (PgdA/CDA1 family)